MDINNLKSCRSYDESMIDRFMEEPEYAEDLLNDVLADGDDYEIQRVKFWYNEAKRRTYWDKLTENVRIAIQDGYNLQLILSKLNEATGIVKAAMA